ncbi:MAG: TonB-dependent receptor plug domain-containing protein, partial [Xanthomonadales bacterium]|nr:TonB-dependent receptor plug domain-containing protein [Xanthomonadales bacterium]
MYTKHSPYPFSRWFSVLLLVLALPFAAIAQPQPQDDEDEEDPNATSLDTVVVTGTHIEGLTEEQLPVTIMDDEAIERTGAINMQDILTYIPSISDFEFEDTNTATNGARGDVAGVNMRNLGSGNTLVLLNGRRMVVHPTFQAINNVPVQAYNVNSIPSSAISRIEVLRDGASPLYGADASAGVVNFVPYTGYDGLNISGRYGWSDDTNYDEAEFTVAGGLEFNGGLTQLGLFGTFYDRSHVHQDELGEFFAILDRQGMDFLPEEWRSDSQWNNGSTLTPYARFRVGMLNEGGQFIGPTRHINPVTGAVGNGNGPARYNFNETQWAVPSTERVNFMATFSHMMDNNLEFFGDAFYYDASSDTQRAASPLDDSLAFLIVPPDAFYNPFPGQEVLLLGWRPVDLGPRIIPVDQDSWRVLGGLRGEWGGW